MYLRILSSFVSRFGEQGESTSSARYGAACAVSFLLCMNIVSVAMLAYGFFGLDWFGFFLNIPASIAVGFILVAINWRLTRSNLVDSVQSSNLRLEPSNGVNRLWIWYASLSTLFFVLSSMLAIAR